MSDHVTHFEPGIDYECLKAIIADVRAGSVSVDTVLHGLWVSGCALALFAGKPPIGLSEEDLAIKSLSLTQLCDEVEQNVIPAASVATTAAIDPATVLLILELVYKLFKQFRNK
jgi:hypothetical protein